MHSLSTSEHGLALITVSNSAATAKIALQGAHIFEFVRRGETPLLWLSPSARFETGKAIRGGIPICWPWFGKNPAHPDWPQHGFARTALWTLESVTEPTEVLSVVTLSLEHTTIEQPYFPHRFRLQLRIGIGESLSVSLGTKNLDDTPFEITEALHSYFTVGDIDKVTVFGLEDITYADNLESFKRKTEKEPITVSGEVDRVYLDTAQGITVKDAKLGRDLLIGSKGSRSTVVWNPWIDKAKAMADFTDEGYKSMICIETANALTNTVTVAPGETHTLTQTVR